MQDSSIEAVAICTPPDTHTEIALSALASGKNVFIEKPLALSIDDCDQIIQQANQSATKVMVGLNMRWHRLIRQAQAVIHQGRLGTVETICSTHTSPHKDESEWLQQRKRGGGVLVELAVHTIDLWCFLLQSKVQNVFAWSRCDDQNDKTATISARMTNGVLATAVLSKETAVNHQIAIYGRTGRLIIDRHRFDGLELFSADSFPGSIRARGQCLWHTLKSFPRGVSSIRQGGDLVNSFRNEWSHFISAIKQDTPFESALDAGRHASQVVLAVLESASSGKMISVDQISQFKKNAGSINKK